MAGTGALRSRRVVTPEGVRPATVRFEDGVIREIAAHDAAGEDLGDHVLMPGVVDAHVHVNEPGRTEWEGFDTATRAAAAGGVTTLCDMPLNSIPVTTTAAALATKRAAARGQVWIDVAMWGGLIAGGATALEALLAAGVPGVKCFLVHSGIDEFPAAGEADLDAAMPVLARHGAVLLVHAELAGPIDAASARLHAADPRAYATHLASRPPAAEDEAIALMIRLAERHRCRVHIVHLSSASALPMLAGARARGVPITVETCPHYLTFAAEDVPPGRTEYKCAPPIRERDNRELLWKGLVGGVIDLVVSDHSPCTPALKKLAEGDFPGAWGGIASLQLALAATWSGARARGIALERVVDWMCRAPARLARLDRRKGAIAPGLDADLVAFAPERTFRVEPGMLRHRHRVTPYAGRELFGVVERTWLRGRPVHPQGERPHGLLLGE